MDKKRTISTGYFLFALMLAWLFNDLIFQPMMIRETEVSYNVFLQDLSENKIEQVSLANDRITFTLKATDNQKKSVGNVVAVVGTAWPL